ncbi:MAG: winged helix-turn-helix transcriptional regulator [Candidatus Thorarchaeota archaeon]
MDVFDRVLMGELAANCRVSFTDLAKKYDVSVNTIKKRVEDLVEEGVIVAFDAQIPLGVIGGNFAVIMMKLTSKWSADIVKNLGKHPNIYAIAAGIQPEAFALVVYRSNQELTQTIDELRSSQGVSDTETIPLLPPLVGGLPPPSKSLDDLKKIDWKILQKLRWNGRMQLGDLADSIGSSPASVRKRLRFMRENSLVSETILVNPSVTQGMVVMFSLDMSELSSEIQHGLDTLLAKEFPDNYWLSWRVADRSNLLLTFQVQSTKEVIQLGEGVLNLLEGASIVRQLIVGIWEYFPDFRDDLIAQKLDAYR